MYYGLQRYKTSVFSKRLACHNVRKEDQCVGTIVSLCYGPNSWAESSHFKARNQVQQKTSVGRITTRYYTVYTELLHPRSLSQNYSYVLLSVQRVFRFGFCAFSESY